MNVNYELYKVFFVVASCETITEASKKLYISQPAITKSIKKLEEQLHTTLFVRSVKGTTLTSEGKKFYEQIKPAIEQLLAAENELSNQSKKIIIGIDDISIQQYLTNPIKNILNQNKNLKLQIKEEKTNNLIDDIINGNIDLAITTPNLNQIQNYKINTYKLLDLNLCLVGNTKLTSLPTSKYEDMQIITTNPNFISAKNKIIVDNYSQVKELVKQKLGIGIIPKEFIQKELNENKLFIIKNNIADDSLYIITNLNNINNYVIRFKKLIIGEINKHLKETIH